MEIDPAELLDRLRGKQEEIKERKRLLDEKEHHLVELQKSVLKRETDVMNQKAKLDACQAGMQNRETEQIRTVEDIREKLKRKARKLEEKETQLLQMEADVNAKHQDAVLLKDDINMKSKKGNEPVEQKLGEKEKLLQEYELTLKEKEASMAQSDEVPIMSDKGSCCSKRTSRRGSPR